MIRYVLRENLEPEIYNAEEDKVLDSYKIFEKEYPYLLDSMKKESFLLESNSCDLFKEILFEKKGCRIQHL